MKYHQKCFCHQASGRKSHNTAESHNIFVNARHVKSVWYSWQNYPFKSLSNTIDNNKLHIINRMLDTELTIGFGWLKCKQIYSIPVKCPLQTKQILQWPSAQRLTYLHKLRIDKWFQSHLSNCKFTVNLQNSFSEVSSMSCGVPQGSILGPLSFLIYVNDIPMAVECNLFLYADDTCLIFQS